VSIGLYGGTFDPPHNGHVALLEGAERHLRLDELRVLVVADPGHRETHAPAPARLALTQAAFPGRDVRLDDHARTVDLLRAGRFDDPVFLIGADEFAAFLEWKEPNAVLELARLGVAGRPGFGQTALEQMREALDRPERVVFFEIEPHPVSSTEIRRRVAAGEPVAGLVPDAVAREIERLSLYRGG